MKNQRLLDCDYYIVEEVNGVKCIRICGYFYYCGESCVEGEPDKVYRSLEVSMDAMPISEFKKIPSDDIWDFLAENNQWIGDLTEEEVDEAMDNYYGINDPETFKVITMPGTELSLSKVDENTPCGNYVDYEAA